MKTALCHLRLEGFFRAHFCVVALATRIFLLSTPVSSPATDAPPSTPTLPPPVPVVRSPVAFFRELRAASSEERDKLLAGRSPENRKAILAKIREYESLPPDKRELRLQVTELRYYLLPLMRTDATNRQAELAAIPEDNRQRVAERIRMWDRLPASGRAELLANEATLRYFTENASVTREQQDKTLTNMPSGPREKLEAGIRQWQALPTVRREELLSQFNQFFDLNGIEKLQALNRLSEPERKQIEKTLRSYQSLTSAQRAQCLRSFDKFASLSLRERREFLKNADRWKLMTPKERQAWREVVETVALLPPSVDLPPMPPHALPHRNPPLATNGN